MVGWAVVAAAVFSGWHYVGSLGDPWNLPSFVFRMVCGLVLHGDLRLSRLRAGRLDPRALRRLGPRAPLSPRPPRARGRARGWRGNRGASRSAVVWRYASRLDACGYLPSRSSRSSWSGRSLARRPWFPQRATPGVPRRVPGRLAERPVRLRQRRSHPPRRGGDRPAHYRGADGRRRVFLRSALRPPAATRPPEAWPIPEAPTLGAIWELPAGLVELDERSPEGLQRSAARELLEEVGFDVPRRRSCRVGPSTFPAPGMVGERHCLLSCRGRPGSARGRRSRTGPPPRAVRRPSRRSRSTRRSRSPARGVIEDAKTVALRRLAELGDGEKRLPHAPRRRGVAGPSPLVVKRSAWQVYREERKERASRGSSRPATPRSRASRRSHEAHEQTVREVEAALAADRGRARRRCATRGESFDASELDLVITVGGDGTLLARSHVGDVPILAINSAPRPLRRLLLRRARPATPAAAIAAVRGAARVRAVLTRMAGHGERRARHRAASLNDALFCHVAPAATSRYVLRLGAGGGAEVERLLDRSRGRLHGRAALRGRPRPAAHVEAAPARRPRALHPHGEAYRLRHALIPPGASLVVRSKTHDAKLFFDGADPLGERRLRRRHRVHAGAPVADDPGPLRQGGSGARARRRAAARAR